jgi:hypothetical protein
MPLHYLPASNKQHYKKTVLALFFTTSACLSANISAQENLVIQLPALKAVDAKPVILPIDTEWNVQIGEVPLSIPLIIDDEEKSGFLIDLTSSSPTLTDKSYGFSKLYLEPIKKRPTIDFKWAPTAKQKLAKYSVTFRANEIADNGIKQFSAPIKTNVYVWPPRPVSSKNVISQFIISKANWVANTLTLNGNISFKKTASPSARTAALKTLKLQVKSNSGVNLGSPITLKPTAKGIWSSKVTLSRTQVPCIIKADYEKLIAARTVSGLVGVCKK